MADVVNGYITTDDLREQLGDLKDQRLSQNQLVRAVNSASRALDRTTGRRFWSDAAPVTKQVEVVPCDLDLWLTEDIASSTGLVVATDVAGNGSYSTVWDPSDFRLWPYHANTPGSQLGGWEKLESTGRLRFDIRGINGRHGVLPIQITARWGWAFLPPEIEEAALLVATALFKRKDAPYGVAQFGDIAAVQVVRTDKHVQDLIWSYMRDPAAVG